LSNASYGITLVADLVVVSVVWPAYRRTRERAFFLLASGFALAIFDTICDHNIGHAHKSPLEFVAYWTLRRLTYCADIILVTWGVVLLVKLYLAAIRAKTLETENT
jgi:hypothetical protein